jgi:uncharacterized alkaline shock family protein YloU
MPDNTNMETVVREGTTPTLRGDARTARPRPSTSSMHADDMGMTTIADVVVAKIASIAAREVEGVHDLVAAGVGATVSGLAQRVMRSDMRGHGVDVEVGTRETAMDLNIRIDYGANIPDVCARVRGNIANRVQSMTGLTVKEININVVDLFFAPDEEAEQKRRVE